MSKIIFTVEPQRSNGVQYVTVFPHQATSWAVVSTTTKVKNKLKYTTRKVISREATKTQAESAAAFWSRSQVKPSRVYKLGQRIGVSL